MHPKISDRRFDTAVAKAIGQRQARAWLKKFRANPDYAAYAAEWPNSCDMHEDQRMDEIRDRAFAPPRVRAPWAARIAAHKAKQKAARK